MALKDFFKIVKGVLLRKVSAVISYETENEGIIYNNQNSQIRTQIEGADRLIITGDQLQALTNKTIDLDNNTLSNIEVDNFKSGVIDTDLSSVSGSHDTIATAKATVDWITAKIAEKDQAIEITYSNATSGLVAINVQTAIDEVEGRLDTAESNISTNATNISNHLSDAVDAHDASAISTVDTFTNSNGTDVQTVLDNLDDSITTNASNISTVSTNLANHLSDAVDAHDASAISVVDTLTYSNATDVQTVLDDLDTAIGNVVSSAGTVASDLANHLSDAVDAHDASAISVIDTFANSNATEVQTALDDLDSAISTNATNIGTVSTNLSNHISDTTTHGTIGDIVGTSDTQALTNKTIVAGNNTISGLLHGTHVDNPSSGVHGVVGSLVGTSDSQNLSNKTLVGPVISGTEVWQYAKQRTLTQNINNNQTNTSISGLVFTATSHSAKIHAIIQIDAGTDYYTSYDIEAVNINGTWSISYSYTGDTSGITFDISGATGQITYTSPNFASFNSGFIKCFITSIELT
jgi:hypothetical protein